MHHGSSPCLLAHPPARPPACLPARLPACLPTLPVFPPSLPACLPALPPSLPPSLPACLPSLPPCLPSLPLYPPGIYVKGPGSCHVAQAPVSAPLPSCPPPAAPINLTQAFRLGHRFAPIVYMHPEDWSYPADPEPWIMNATLFDSLHSFRTSKLADPGNVEVGRWGHGGGRGVWPQRHMSLCRNMQRQPL